MRHLITGLVAAALLQAGSAGAANAVKPIADQGFDLPAAAILKNAPTATAFPNSGAITLRDETRINLNADGSGLEKTHQIVRIFNARGRDNADIAIPYNASTQSVIGIHARTIKPNGSIVPVKLSDIHVSSPFADYTMYDDAKIVRFSMPAVEDGAIMDCEYTVKTRRATLPGHFSEQWTFQGDSDPVTLSKLTIQVPVFLGLQAQVHNAPKIAAQVTTGRDGKTKTYVWQQSSLPDLSPEPMMPPGETFLPWMEISTVPSWQTVAQWYQGLAGPRMTATPEVKALVKQLTAGKTTDTEKAKALFYWVEAKTRYVALELGLSAYQPHSATAVCTNRYGDCKDMATLLVTMLREAGIKTAWPVLLNAGHTLPERDHLASPGAFDHAIVRADIDGKPFWLDCTAELSSFGEIPGGDRGVDAFVIRDGVGTFETIPTGTPDDNQMRLTSTVALHADGSADCVVTTQAKGDAALGLRAGLRAIKPDQMQSGFANMARQMSANATLTQYSMTPPEERDKPMGFQLSYHAPVYASATGSLLIISGDNMSTTGVSLPSRQYPMYQNHMNRIASDTTLTLPAGYTLPDKPADMHLKTALGEIAITYALSGDTLTIHKVIDDVPALVMPSDYPQLKTALESVASQIKQPIVLQKTTVK